MRKKLIAVLIAAYAICMGSAASAKSLAVSALMYHDVVETEEELSTYSVLPWQIESDIQLLIASGYTFITPSELLDIDPDAETRKLIMLTVDDGYESFYTKIYPLCQKYGIKANLNMIAAKVGTPGAVTAEQLKEMTDSGLIEIGNHTYLLHKRPDSELWGIYCDDSMFEDILYDISLSDKILQSITGRKIITMAYPNGITTKKVDNEVKSRLGYRISFSTNYDIISYNGDFSMPLNRMNRDYGQSSADVLAIIEQRSAQCQ